MRSYPSRVILGVPIAAITLSEISHLITNLIGSKRKKTFFYVNAYCLNIANRDEKYKRILQKAFLVYPGGFGPVLASKILGQPLPERTPTPDFIFDVLAIAKERKWSIYLLGGEEHVAKKASEKLKEKFPNLLIVGYHSGHFTKREEKVIIGQLNSKKPTILLVGMGTPRQEKWIAENIDNVDAKVFWAVGALFDFISGRLKRAPFWMQRMGLEWLFRLFQEPTRLWKRYLLGNIEFIYLVLKEALRKTGQER